MTSTPRRVLLLAHPGRPEALEVAMGVADRLTEAGIEVRLPAGELADTVDGSCDAGHESEYHEDDGEVTHDSVLSKPEDPVSC